MAKINIYKKGWFGATFACENCNIDSNISGLEYLETREANKFDSCSFCGKIYTEKISMPVTDKCDKHLSFFPGYRKSYKVRDKSAALIGSTKMVEDVDYSQKLIGKQSAKIFYEKAEKKPDFFKCRNEKTGITVNNDLSYLGIKKIIL